MRKFFVGVMLILSLFGSVSLPGGTEGQPSSEPLDKKAIVQVVSFFFDGEGNYLTHKTGSGSIIREDGLILTNSHVIRSTSGGCGRPILETDPIADFIAVLVLEEEGLPPVPRYVATAEKEDRALDVATLKIEESIKLDISQEGGQKANLNDLVEAVKEKRYQLEAVPPLELPKLGLGDSNSIRPGGFVKTYGYPALEELPRFTVTRGNISQVQEDFILVEHAFAARGSSGGAIIEEANQLLVGVLCGGGPEPSVYTGELLARARPLNSIITILPEDVYQHPLAAFTFSPEHPLLGQSVQFDASASRSIGATITKYEWDFDGDGVFDMEGKVVTKTFAKLPSRKVTLRVTNDRGYSSIVTHMVPLWSRRLIPGKCTIIREGGKVQEFQFIQDCIDAAQEGDTILVSPGRYRESLLIDKGLTLKAEGEVILEGDSQIAVITIVEAEGVTVEGFTITNGLPGVNIEDSRSVSIVGNTFQENLGWGIVFRRSSGEVIGNEIKETMWDTNDRWGRGIQLFDVPDDLQVAIADNSILENDDAGINLLDAAAEIKNNTVNGNRNRGISIEGGSTATLADNAIKGNMAFGVFIIKSRAEIRGGEIAESRPDINGDLGNGIEAGEDSRVLVTEAEISTNCRNGLVLSSNAIAQITSSAITKNEGIGAVIRDQSKVDFANITISSNSSFGLLSLDSTKVTINDAHIFDNRASGILAAGIAQVIVGKDSRISGNIRHGIALGGSARAEIHEAKVFGNWGDGISLWWGSAGAIISNTQITGNSVNGINMFESTSAEITQSRISNNGWHGISMGHSVHATIEDNDILDNKGCGIRVWSQEARVHGSNNRMGRNGADLCRYASSFLRLPLAPATSSTSLSVPGDYPTIQEAIDAIAPGGAIILASQVYEAGLTIWKPLVLRGTGNERTILKALPEGRVTVSITAEAQEVRLEALTVTGSAWDGIWLNGRVMIANAQISGNRDDGIDMEGSAKAEILNSKILNNGGAGIDLDDSATATISLTQISNNLGEGIDMGASSSVTIQNSHISGNSLHGMLIKNSASAVIGNNMIKDNDSWGVLLLAPCFSREPFTGKIEGSSNVITSNGSALSEQQKQVGDGVGNVCPKELEFLMTEEGGSYP